MYSKHYFDYKIHVEFLTLNSVYDIYHILHLKYLVKVDLI